ncbi:uncharacterized protein LOC135376209 [Ornithodoros turicata]|uniref:uncharacterized protein LOC135376209 n=1 Tax=Ornithodoros turicata TaxID=34597 RepID=UPI003138879B
MLLRQGELNAGCTSSSTEVAAPKERLQWPEEMEIAKGEVWRPSPARRSHVPNDSDNAIGAAQQQEVNGVHVPLVFLSRKLSPTEYSAFGKYSASVATYSAVRHFRHSLEGRSFTVSTDHKPLVDAFSSASTKYSPREIKHLAYISEFTTDIRHIKGPSNAVEDALSRVHAVTRATVLSADAIAHAQSEDSEIAHLRSGHSTSLKLAKDLPVPGCPRPVLCDTTNAALRPVILAALRKIGFDSFHGLAHLGVRASTALVLQWFVWPGARQDIRRWVRTCSPCQLSKCHRHTVSPLATFLPPSSMFSKVHLDIISCFGVPEDVITDRGPQLESHLFAAFLRLIETERIRTSAYRPACNGLVERFHRYLKQAVMAHGDRVSWTDSLPSILLGIRATANVDLCCSSTELFTPTRAVASPAPFVPSELSSTPDVFLRTDRLRRALEPPYSGPYKVLRRSRKSFVIDDYGRPESVSIDRLKPAFIDNAPRVCTLSGPSFPASPTSVPVKHVTWTDSVPHANRDANPPVPSML